jgi:diguanylate cyclase (GGDEF)-like protein
VESVFRRILGEVLTAVSETQDIDSLLGDVCATLLSLHWIDRVVVALCEPDITIPVIRSAVQKPGVGAKLPFVGDKVQYREEDLARLASHEVPYLQFASGEEESERISEVGLCLVSGDSHLGLLVVGKSGGRNFSFEECDLLLDFSRIISLAVENRLVSSGEWRAELRNSLAGFCSQRHFQAKVSEEIRRVDRYGGVFSILIAGIDNRDYLSRKKKDSECAEALKAVAPLFKQRIREVDIVAVCSESELAVFLPHTDEAGSLRVANRLISGLRQVEFNGKPPEKVSFSIGAATYPDDSAFRDGLLEAADIALCCARASGGDRVMSCKEASLQR